MRKLAPLFLGFGLACATPSTVVEAPIKPVPPPEPPVVYVPAPIEPWRTQPPQSSAKPIAPKAPTRFKLENGLTVLLYPKSSTPVLQAAVVTAAGSAYDPKERQGLSYLTHAMLRDGSGVRDASEFETALRDIGAQMSTYVYADRGIVTMRGLPQYGEQILELLSDALSRPDLPEESLDARKKMEIEGLNNRPSTVVGIARERLPGIIHGESSAVGHAATGRRSTLDIIRRKHVQDFYDNHIAPERAALILAGAWSEAKAREWVERTFGRWIKAEAPKPNRVQVDKPGNRKVIVVHKNNVTQSFVCLAKPTVPAGNEEELPMEVANFILGGSFGSRLQSNLREDKGYTYGIESAYEANAFTGELVVCSSVKKESTPKALSQIMLELKGLTERPPSDDEIRVAARALAGRTATSGQTVGGSVDEAARAFAAKRPATFESDRVTALLSLDPEKVRQAAKKNIDPSTMHVIMVGDARVLTQAATEAGLPTPAVVMEK